MTVAYAYFRYVIDRENHKTFLYCLPGSPNDRPIARSSSRPWGIMTKNKIIATDVGELEAPAEGTPHKEPHLADQQKKSKQAKCCSMCFKVLYVLLSIKAIILSLGVIALAVLASVTTKIYDAEQSHRLAAMVLLIFTAGLVLSLVISGLVALSKTNNRTLHVVTVVLIIMAVVQAVLVGACVNVSPKEEEGLVKSLGDSFKLAQEGSPRHVKLWDSTQNDLNCCGLYGADDYRGKSAPFYFPPNVPVSCCPTYDPGRSDMGQEREREACRARKAYFDVGCTTPVLEVFKETASYVMGVSICLIVVEVLLTAVGAVIIKKGTRRWKEHTPPIDTGSG